MQLRHLESTVLCCGASQHSRGTAAQHRSSHDGIAYTLRDAATGGRGASQDRTCSCRGWRSGCRRGERGADSLAIELLLQLVHLLLRLGDTGLQSLVLSSQRLERDALAIGALARLCSRDVIVVSPAAGTWAGARMQSTILGGSPPPAGPGALAAQQNSSYSHLMCIAVGGSGIY